MRALCAIAMVAALGYGPGILAQNPPSTFRSEVRVIDVDVFVTDKGGRFVRDLRQDDFEILEDGKPQKVVTFSFNDLPVEGAKPVEAAQDGTEPDITTNRSPTEGRVYVLLMDSPSTEGPGGLRTSITYDEYARRFARQFVEQSVAPGDQVAVVHAQGTFSDAQTFTTSRSLVLASVGRYGRGLNSAAGWEELTGPEMVTRNLNTFRAIQDLSERLGAINGRRKAILWLGGQMLFNPSPLGECTFPDPRNLCAIKRAAAMLNGAYRDAIGAATRNNVAIYPIDPSGLTTELGIKELERTVALRAVAEDTGGIAVVSTNNLDAMYRDIVRDNSTYYLLGYTPATADRDGKFHGIQVRVKRPGVTVRARKGYYAPAKDPGGAAPPPPPDGVSVSALDALRLPLPTRGLAIDLFTAPFKGPGQDGSVVIGGQISGNLRLEDGEPIAVSYQVFTPEGAIQIGQYKVYTLTLKSETRARVNETGVRFVDRIELPPGRYELRLVADQRGNPLGSIVTHLEVPKFDDPLELSGIVLAASSAAEHVTLRGDAPLRDVLGAEPTAVRRFLRGDTVNLFAEVYAGNSRTRAEDVSVMAVVTTPEGREVKREAGWVEPLVGPGSEIPGRWGVDVELSLTDVEPGSYVLTISAESPAHAGHRPQKRIPFVVQD